MSFLKKEVSLPKLSVPKLPRRPAHGPGIPGRTPKFSSRGSNRARPSASRGSGVTGLDINATQLIAAEAHLEGGSIHATRVAVRDMPAGLVRDGIVTDPVALAHELQEFFSEHRLGRRVRVGLATPRTILRVIDLPPLGEEDIEAALRLQAQDRIPMPMESAVLDHQTMGLVDTPEGQRMRVIVVATERTATEVLLEALRKANLRPVGIDLSIFAAIRAVSGAERPAAPVLYAQLGDLVNLAIAEAGVCRFTRQAPQGLAYVLEQLAERHEISTEEARALLFSAAGEDGDADPDDVREIGALLAQVATELGSELRTAAEFYGTQSGSTVAEGIVTGPLAPLIGFVPALAEASGLELRCGDVDAEGAALGNLAPAVAAVAIGLSVGSLER